MSNNLSKWRVFKKKYLTWGKSNHAVLHHKDKLTHEIKVIEDQKLRFCFEGMFDTIVEMII